MKKRHTYLLSLITTVGLMATACSGSGHEGKKEAGQGSQDNKDEQAMNDIASTPAEVVFYSSNGDPTESFDLRFGNLIRKKFPNFTIKYIQKAEGTNLPELLAAGTRFDIFFQTIGNFEAVAFDYSIDSDMNDLIAKRSMDLSRLEPTIMDAIRQRNGGKIYALPVANSNLVLYYNKGLFDKFGVPYPKDGMSWEEVSVASAKLSRFEGGVQYFGYTHSSPHSIRMRQLPIPLADLKTDLPSIHTDERWKSFFEHVYLRPNQEATVKQYMQTTNKAPGPNEFAKTQTVAMFNYQSSLITVWENEFMALDWDMVSLPTFPELPGTGSSSYPSYFGMTRMAQNKEAVMEVLNYMVSDEFQTELARLGVMPVLKNREIQQETGRGSVFKEKNWNALFYHKFAALPVMAPYEAELVSIYSAYGMKVQLGTLDLNTALRQAEEDAKKKIKEYKQKQQK